MAVNLPSLAVKGSKGFNLLQPTDYKGQQGFQPDESKSCKVFQFSHDGKRLAWSNMSTVQIAVLQDDGVWTVSVTLQQPKVNALHWSPLSTLLTTWETYGHAPGQEPKPNLHLWDPKTGEKVKSFFQKKFAGWCPMWTQDEGLCSRMVNNEVQFYANNDFSTVSNKIHMEKLSNFSMSSVKGSPHIVTCVPGQKGGPSFCKLFQFPNFGDNQVLGNKSFFQADSVDIMWNSPGTGVLLLVQSEVDKTGASYYGKQQLYFMTVKGETSMVSLSKDGPIYSVVWSPKGDVFAVVFGFMPAKAALFNMKGDQIYDFGKGHRNEAIFNPQSNILMIGGFGNLRGKVEMWDISVPTKPDLISSFDAPDTTDVKWNPDGQHLLTNTCAPRLRQGNGFKIWHYSGSLLHEQAIEAPEELWEAGWQTAQQGTFPTFKTSKQLVKGITSSQPQAVSQAYRPPGARGTVSNFRFTLHDDDEDSAAPKKGTKEENLSKSALKNKKRKEAAKKKKEEEEVGGAANKQDNAAINITNQNTNGYMGAAGILFDPEKEKKKKKINEKLASIQALKKMQTDGKVLEKNQLEKVSREAELLDELKKLSMR